MSDKKFKDTKVGQFLKRAAEKLPEIGGVALEVATGDIGGAIEKVQDILETRAQVRDDAKKLLIEWEQYKMDFQKELIALENADRDSARQREVGLAQATGQRDWMQLIAGAVGLGLLASVIYVGLTQELKNREIYLHVLGVVEGVGISIFAYYFGSSKGSKDKQSQINKLSE